MPIPQAYILTKNLDIYSSLLEGVLVDEGMVLRGKREIKIQDMDPLHGENQETGVWRIPVGSSQLISQHFELSFGHLNFS